MESNPLSLYTVEQVAAMLQVKKDWIYDHVEAGDFPCIRLGRQLRFRHADVEAYLASLAA